MKTRQGFTLVELMVAMTLTLFVMLILTQAFVTSLDTFDDLKGLGDMEAHLRLVATTLRNDLAQDHFEGKRRLSDPDFWSTPLKEGFFYVRQQSGSQNEGADSNNIPSYTTWKAPAPSPTSPSPFPTPAYHMLYFTNRLKGNREENFYAATDEFLATLTPAPNFFGQPPDALYQGGNRYHSQWSEIAYFLVPTGTTVDPNDFSFSTGGTPLHALYRAQYLLVPNTVDANDVTKQPAVASGAAVDAHPNISCVKNASDATRVLFNSPADVTVPGRRTLQMETMVAGDTVPNRRDSSVVSTLAAPAPPPGSTLLMTNVVAFNVRVVPFMDSLTAVSGDTDLSTTFPAAFESSVTSSPGYRLHGLEITVRIWDSKTGQSRQITVVQGL